MTWILVIVFTWVNPTAIQVPGFASRQECLAAREATLSTMQMPNTAFRVQTFCIPGPTRNWDL